MKQKLLLLSLLAFITAALMAFRFNNTKRVARYSFSPEQYRKKIIFHCSPDWSSLKDWLEETNIPPLPGWGNYSWKVTTKSDSAQFYFDQGINMYYAFHIIESMASFKKAEKFDPGCAMLLWGQALAYGPNINDLGYAASPDALAATNKAIELSGHASAKEKILIQAQQVRYSPDSTVAREKLNQDYADNMKTVYQKYPGDADIAALYADALMLQHPWDLWEHTGKPKPWTPLIELTLEKLLKQHPSHPGANHYYIHTMEASGHPEKGLASAERLGKLMPGVSHVVHMPSHIYIRTGNYQQGTVVNEKAIKGFETYMSLYPDVVNNAPLYSIHNLHMQSACAQMNGNYVYAMKSSDDCRNSFDTSFMSLPSPLDGYIQFVYMTPVFTQIRFGKWDEILASPGVPENYIYAHLLRHFAKGVAFARKNDAPNAKRELTQMVEKINEPMMLVRFGPFNTPQGGAKVAEEILRGAIAEAENDLPAALSHYQQAVKNEDAMIYNEPKDWLLPAREYLGAVQLKAGLNTGAEKTFREDLKENPHNGWSLFGLYQSLLKQKKTSEAAKTMSLYKTSFAKADIKLTAPVF